MARKTKVQASETRQQIIDAARLVFYQCGLGHSSLDRVAREAGVTRGAVYWHFRDKAELFAAVRANVLSPVFEEIDSIIGCDAYADPLDSIEQALGRFFQILDNCPSIRIVLEIIINRCERIAEFASVQSELDRPAAEFLVKLEYAYRKAAVLGALPLGLSPQFVARDTWAFVHGLMYRVFAGGDNHEFRNQIPKSIALHMSLRRVGPISHSETVDTPVQKINEASRLGGTLRCLSPVFEISSAGSLRRGGSDGI